MSWWVYLLGKDGEPVIIDPPHQEGGTYCMGGTDRAELNVTYNYGGLFHAAFDGLGFRDALQGKRAKDVTDLLERACERLGSHPSDDYWEASEGNAGHALAVLYAWALQYPNAVFEVH